jgi:hypothetical protein
MSVAARTAKLQTRLQVGLFVIGALLLAAGVVALFPGEEVGGIAMVFFGVVLLVLALFFHRLEEVKWQFAGNTFRAKLAAVAGPDLVRELETAGLADDISAYTFIHETLGETEAYKAAKIRLQDTLVYKVKDAGLVNRPSKEEIMTLLSGSPAERVLALGFVYSDPRLQTVEVLEGSILRPRSGNEQYHAMKIAKSRVSDFSSSDRSLLVEFVRDRPYQGRDTSNRDVLAQQIIDFVEGSDDG